MFEFSFKNPESARERLEDRIALETATFALLRLMTTSRVRKGG
jgi:hypothetical protein